MIEYNSNYSITTMHTGLTAQKQEQFPHKWLHIYYKHFDRHITYAANSSRSV